MNKISSKIILVSIVVLLFGGSFFTVLAVEGTKRLAKIRSEQQQFLENVREAEQARQAYLENVAQSREASRKEMDAAKDQYESLLKDQPSLIQDNQKQTVTTVKELVPVADSSNVSSTQTSKPKSTSTTKTS